MTEEEDIKKRGKSTEIFSKNNTLIKRNLKTTTNKVSIKKNAL
jgi:hypothetical protein